MNNNKYSLVIVDCDGTLVDTKHDIIFALNLTLREFDYDEYSEEEITAHVGSGITPLIKARVKSDDIDAIIERFGALYSENISRQSSVYEGWNALFELRLNITFVVLSNKPQGFLDLLIPALKLDRFFDVWFGREAFSEIKPSPVPVLEIMKKYNRDSSETLIVGDMNADIVSGKDANISTVAALYGYGDNAQLLETNPSYVIKTPSDLVNILQAIR